jgi:hypothetical protein
MSIRAILAISPVTSLLSVLCSLSACAPARTGDPSSPRPARARKAGAATTYTTAFRVKAEPYDEKKVEAPKQLIHLVLGATDGTEHPLQLGVHQGTCGPAEVADTPLVAGHKPLLALRCWWAGAGSDLFVVVEGREVTVYRRWLEEGTAEEKGMVSKPEKIGSWKAPGDGEATFTPAAPQLR